MFAGLFTFNLFLLRRISGYLFDDAYIHLNIAKELALTGQPYFNSGEAIMVSSSHGWILSLAFLFKIFGFSLDVVFWLESLSLTSLFLGIYCLTKKTLPRFFSFLAALILVYGVAAPIAAGGMETPMCVALVVGAYLFFSEGKNGWGAVLLSAAVFYRYEAIVFALLSLPLCWRNKSALTIYATFAFAFISYCLVFYGTLVPQPLIAKKIILPAHSSFFSILFMAFPIAVRSATSIYFTKDISLLSAARFNQYVTGRYIVGNFLAATLICYFGLLKSFFKRPIVGWAAALSIGAGVITSLHLLHGAILSEWYLPVFTIPFCVGFLGICRQRHSVIFALMLIMSGFVWEASSTLDMRTNKYTRTIYAEYNSRTKSYQEAGEWIASTHPNASVYTAEIGSLKWTCHCRIIDGLALATPEALQYQPLKPFSDRHGFIVPGLPTELVVSEKPDFIVSFAIFADKVIQSINDNPKEFPYKLVKTFTLPGGQKFLEQNEILVYQRD